MAASKTIGRPRPGANPTEISRTMNMLAREGLVENVGGEGVANERWQLTPAGQRAEREIRAQQEQAA